jgi:hypothetical protein
MTEQAVFHPWPAEKVGGSDPDRCPACGQTSYRRALRWDGQRWRRPALTGLSCSSCGQVWTPRPLGEQPKHTDSILGRPGQMSSRFGMTRPLSTTGANPT